MRTLVRTSPERLATRYGLLAGGANALLAMASLLGATSRAVAFETALSLLSWAVLLGSLLLFVHLGYVARGQVGRSGVAVGPGIKAGALFSLDSYVGFLVYLVGSGWLFRLNTLGPAWLVAILILTAFLWMILASLIGAGPTLLGATVAHNRPRA